MSQYHIYQTNADYGAKGWGDIRKEFSMDDYRKVYSGDLLDSISFEGHVITCNENDNDVLEAMFHTFSENVPEWYKANPVSVGDVVEICRSDASRLYYCDHIGWELIHEEPSKQNK